MRFSDFKIGVRLAGGFGLVMLLIVGMAMAGIWRLQSVGDLTEEMVGSASVKERLTAEWHNQIGISGIGVLAFARNTETAESPAITEKAAATRARVNAIQKQLEPMLVSDEEKALLAAVASVRKDYAASRDAMFKLKKSGDIEAARRLADDRLEPQFAAYLSSVAKIGKYEADVGRELACCSVRADRSRLPWAISPEAVAMVSVPLRTCPTILTRLAFMSFSACSSRPVSSLLRTSILLLKSPAATVCATSTA